MTVEGKYAKLRKIQIWTVFGCTFSFLTLYVDRVDAFSLINVPLRIWMFSFKSHLWWNRFYYYADSILVVRDLRSTSDHVQIIHSVDPFGSWAMLKDSKHHFGPFRIAWFKEIVATGLKNLDSDCAHLISCYSAVFPSQSASKCYSTVYYLCLVYMCQSLFIAHGKRREPFFWEKATGILDSQVCGRAFRLPLCFVRFTVCRLARSSSGSNMCLLCQVLC